MLQDTKLPDDKTSVRIPVNSALTTFILDGNLKIGYPCPTQFPKRGQERVFSTSTFVPKKKEEDDSNDKSLEKFNQEINERFGLLSPGIPPGNRKK